MRENFTRNTKKAIDELKTPPYIRRMTAQEIIQALHKTHDWRAITRMTGTGVRQLQKIKQGKASPSGALDVLLKLLARKPEIRKELLE